MRKDPRERLAFLASSATLERMLALKLITPSEFEKGMTELRRKHGLEESVLLRRD